MYNEHQASQLREDFSENAMINRVMSSFEIGMNPYPTEYTVDRMEMVEQLGDMFRGKKWLRRSPGTKSASPPHNTTIALPGRYFVIIGAAGVGKTTAVLEAIHRLPLTNGTNGVVYYNVNSAAAFSNYCSAVDPAVIECSTAVIRNTRPVIKNCTAVIDYGRPVKAKIGGGAGAPAADTAVAATAEAAPRRAPRGTETRWVLPAAAPPAEDKWSCECNELGATMSVQKTKA